MPEPVQGALSSSGNDRVGPTLTSVLLDVATQWHPRLNDTLTAHQVTPKATIKVWVAMPGRARLQRVRRPPHRHWDLMPGLHEQASAGRIQRHGDQASAARSSVASDGQRGLDSAVAVSTRTGPAGTAWIPANDATVGYS